MVSRGSTDPADGGVLTPEIGEPRWPVVVSVVAFMVLNVSLRLWLPSEGLVGGRWLLPAIELILLVVLVTADPSRHSRRVLRRLVLSPVICCCCRPCGRRRCSSTA